MNFSHATIVYGSQTGTAHDLAQWISSRFTAAGYDSSYVSGTELCTEQPMCQSKLYIFVVATAGNGDFPINFRRFEEHLFNAALIPGALTGLRVAVFGLGDSKYSQYNYASRLLFGRLLHLRAVPLLALGCGDDQATLGYAQEFLPWFRELWLVVTGRSYSEGPTRITCKYSVVESPKSKEGNFSVINESSGCFARVVLNARVTSRSHFQDVRKLRLQVLQPWSFSAGDVMSVFPSVDIHVANKFVSEILLDDPERSVSISLVTGGDLPFGECISLRELFLKFLDITAVPGLYFYQVLSFCYNQQLLTQPTALTEEQELVKDKLALLASFSPEGVFERLRYSGKEKLSIHEVLWDFRCVRIPLANLIDCIPRIAPRYYSVSGMGLRRVPVCGWGSGTTVAVTEVEIIVGVSNSTTLFGRPRRGLASNYLAGLKVGEKISGRMQIERGFVKEAQRIANAKNIIVFATGTGVAPARALIDKYHNEKNMLLFAGFRHPQSDLLLDAWPCVSSKSKCVFAWSRPDDMNREYSNLCWSEIANACALDSLMVDKLSLDANRGRKTWIQDLIPIYNGILAEYLKCEDTVVMIAGRSHPTPDQVVEAMETVAGKERIRSLKQSGKLIFDTWG